MECQKCKKVLSKKGAHFVCQGQCQGTFHKACVKGLAADSKAGKLRIYCNNCEEDDSECEEQEDKSQDTEKLLKDILKKVSAIPVVTKQLDSIKESLGILSDKYDSLLFEQEQSRDKIDKLEKTVTHINNKLVFMEKCNAALEQQVQQFEQATRNQNIIITGVEQLPNEDAKQIVVTIAKKIDVSTDNIDYVRRIQPRKQSNKPAPIIVGFKSSGSGARDQWLTQRKNLVQVTSNKITGGTADTQIYVNEDLSKAQRTLIWITKKKLRDQYNYIWVSNGKVLIKKKDGDKAIWIRSEKDIDVLLK